MSSFEKLLKSYDYAVSPERIAQKPASPRDSARLLVYRRKEDRVFFDRFRQIGNYLPKGAVLVFNKTKVLPARLKLVKATGGRVVILYLHTERGLLQCFSDRKLRLGERLTLNSTISFVVKDQREKYYYLKPSFPIQKLFSILERYGITPLPPYIKHLPLGEGILRKEYQTVFAKERGSVAAPTASLHFTKRLLASLRRKGFGLQFLTLHVGLGTFAPLTESQVRLGRLHQEYFSIDRKTAKALTKAKQEGRPIIAVGTTVARVLESVARLGTLKASSGTTDLFIRDGYKFKVIDGLITNFHVPQSSLLMLVAALTGRKKLFNLYSRAIAKRFRFFSFGDGMLIV